ncbi:hypothetical protein DPMN_003624 [Dreissena polymorpha]|uniref:Uncharacterized protein n=1 Tax=Dreissena polymorpha TaxID=45954 RepID=A0A9D4RUY4_DREPO|nr:hypothetical protein DPMN_003624 [Dreissena polymorpha]
MPDRDAVQALGRESARAYAALQTTTATKGLHQHHRILPASKILSGCRTTKCARLAI